MSQELTLCPLLSDEWCTAFDEPCIALCGDNCKERELIQNRYGSLEKRNETLEAENRRLREALRVIEDFAQDEYWKMIPAPICVKFRTIKQYAEKALKVVKNERITKISM